MKSYRFICLAFTLLCLSLNAFANTRPDTVYIYNDAGVSTDKLLHTIHTFKTVLPSNFKVKTIDAKGVIKNQWSSDAALFVMPGGRDLLYLEKLQGEGNHAIKQYVKNGGAYLGLCAGAYYASSEIAFDKGGPLEVLGPRELDFFKGKMVGPLIGPFDYQTESSAHALKINLTLKNPKETTVYYNGGGYFEHAKDMKNTKIIGYYNTPAYPVIISTNYGKGHVVLSGVHFEYDASLADPRDPFLNKIVPALKASDSTRLALIKAVLKLLHVGSAPADAQCVCIQVWQPVCGEDGKTYSNHCHAACAKVKVIRPGACDKAS